MQVCVCVCVPSLFHSPQLVTVLCAWFRFVFTFLRASFEKNFYAHRTMDMDSGQRTAATLPMMMMMMATTVSAQCQSRASPHCHHAFRQAVGRETGFKMRRRWRWRCAAPRMYLDKQTGQRATKTSAKQQRVCHDR